MTYKSNTKKRDSTDYLVVHCSATKPSADIGAADIDRWHRKQGWRCIGYHYVIRRDGTVEEGRDPEVIGAHVSGHNENSLGICLAGGVSEKDVNVAENNFTPEQFASLQRLLTDLRAKYPRAIIQGHRDFPGVAKVCPSFSVKDWLKGNPIG
ncbi:endolysin [Ralstonia phage P-PSG-11-1]|uniref:Endolysin n=1 Tax=Ralstonia phage P-PSG-11 TaxID=2652430 RepID=A0A5P8D5Y0_9CAUD|nr:endolysin [Ralstonia phage P-PSG-11]QFP93757.1 endolysin [Ralstonia phage P-PSG-11-1]